MYNLESFMTLADNYSDKPISINSHGVVTPIDRIKVYFYQFQSQLKVLSQLGQQALNFSNELFIRSIHGPVSCTQ